MDNLIELTDDLFDICSRLKSVNSDYFVVYNVTKKRFEVHNRSLSKQSLAFVVPFEELDCRTVDYALYTRAENAERIVADIERHNAEAEKAALKTEVDNCMRRLDCAVEE